MRSLAFWISRKFSGRNSKSGSTVRTGKIIAVMGVAFAIAAMEITMGVAVGFKKDITSKLQGFISPLTVTANHDMASEFDPADPDEPNHGLMRVTPELEAVIANTLPSARIVKSLNMQGMLKTDSDYMVVAVKAYEPTYRAEFEKSWLKKGRWIADGDKRTLVVSKTMADQLDLDVDSKINLCYFLNEEIKSRPFTVVGIYDSGLRDFDKYLSFTDFATLQKVYHSEPDEVSMIELKNVPLDSVASAADRLYEQFWVNSAVNPGFGFYQIQTVSQQGAQYLNWLDLLDTNVVVIFILMSLVAACTIISSLFIQVLEKVSTIGLFKAIGMNNRMVSRVFINMSMRLVVWGLVVGNIIGLGSLYMQHTWRVVYLNPEMYYLDYVPTDINWLTIALINVCALVLSWLILMVPAKIATRLSPSVTLRYD